MKVKTALEIDSCKECPHLLSWCIGSSYHGFKWTCLETLRDIDHPRIPIPEWCPLEQAEEDRGDRTAPKEAIDE